jgi:hypothetical protein
VSAGHAWGAESRHCGQAALINCIQRESGFKAVGVGENLTRMHGDLHSNSVPFNF